MKKIMLLMITILTLNAYDVKTFIPKKAYTYGPEVFKQVDEIFPEFILPPYFHSLIEQESCISLTWSRCWSPMAELKTKREQGVGLGQLTRTWYKNGRVRFDKLREMRIKHPKHLKNLTWNNIKKRPDLQIKAIILLWKDDFDTLPKTIDYYNRIAMADSAYNGGIGDIRRDRRLCGLRKNCDPNIWFGNVEVNSRKSRKKLYGNRSAYSINRKHVNSVLNIRLNKYIDFWFKVDENYKYVK